MKKFAPLIAPALFLIASAALAENGEFTLKVEEDAAYPEGLGDSYQEDLSTTAYVIEDGEGVRYKFWMVNGVEIETFGEDAKATLESIPEITLLGVAEVPEAERATDFREDPIDPGIKILRLAMQPQDGNHMGTAPTNTFAILVPAEKDAEIQEFRGHDHLVDVSSENTVAEHPPVLYLRAADDQEVETPAISTMEGMHGDWHMLNFPLKVKAGSDEKNLVLQLVFEGVGDL